jgi:hypothetical protein
MGTSILFAAALRDHLVRQRHSTRIKTTPETVEGYSISDVYNVPVRNAFEFAGPSQKSLASSKPVAPHMTSSGK